GVLYATASWSIVFALDAATGREIWRYDPLVPRHRSRFACCDVVNRGVALYEGKVFVGTIDGRLIALDAKTGEPVWERLTVDPSRPYTITGAPRVYDGKVLIGNGGADLGVRGHFSAYDATDGSLLWRFFTVPASIDGPHEHPELALAARTWSRESMFETGLGGTVWDAFAYDPELGLVYAGVGNASVYDREKRSPGGGDNLFLTAILAVDVGTGRLAWHYQTTPGEYWDYTATQHMILADLEIGGRVRRVLMQAPKNGFFYVLDRATGELISADPYVDVSWATGVDPATGRPVERPEAHWSERPATVMPGPAGGHNWHPMTYSPRTGLVYVPSLSNAYPFAPDPEFEYLPGSWNTAEDLSWVTATFADWKDAIPFCSPSHITAWDPVARRRVFRVDHEDATPGGLLSTASDLLFQGTGAGDFSAYDARTGDRLWTVDVGIGVMAAPVTYAIDGEQYVAVLAGMGGSHGGHFSRLEVENDGRVLAFKLGGRAPMPPVRRRPEQHVSVAPGDAPPAVLDRGRTLYARHCLFCHGLGAESSGLNPDLRYATPETHARWNEIVLGGSRQAVGMPSFADRIGPDDAQAIRAWVIARAHRRPGLVERLVRAAGRYVCVPARWTVD
ncbi:MAG TPA: PQQ-dependent dehydrogenase, methanol/ethanol family, partial [Alphaproteobacteria bacterium]|nr:PQQ-dependent dehydrogenase, methanol/ethanol family [Alphaproteobacteria bacterium]